MKELIKTNQEKLDEVYQYEKKCLIFNGNCLRNILIVSIS